MAADGKGDTQFKNLFVLTRTIIKDSKDRTPEALSAFAKAWLYAAIELPEVPGYEKITYAFMQIIRRQSVAFEEEELSELIQKCENRFGHYEVEDLIKYYSSTQFSD